MAALRDALELVGADDLVGATQLGAGVQEIAERPDELLRQIHALHARCAPLEQGAASVAPADLNLGVAIPRAAP
jgi:hypothetical protein